MSRNSILLAAFCLLATIGSAISIYLTQFATPGVQEELHLGVGRAMARETAKLIGNKGHIVIVDMETDKAPELKIQVSEFQKTLKKLGDFTFYQKTLDTEDQDKYRTGAGLSARRFARIVNNHKDDSAAIVSFVGVPRDSEKELEEVDVAQMPKFVAEVRTVEKLKPLFEKKLIHVGIVSRFEFPSPGPAKPGTPEEWFQNRCQVVTSQNSASLP